MDLTKCMSGNPEARTIQFHAFVIVRMAQCTHDCPWYHVLTKYQLWRGLRAELESFDRHEGKLKAEFEKAQLEKADKRLGIDMNDPKVQAWIHGDDG